MKHAAALAVFGAASVCPALYGAAQLAVERIALHQFEDGPVHDASYEFLPGETAYFSCRFNGYQTQTLDDDRELAKLTWRMEVRDPTGALLEPPAEGRINAELFPEDDKWLPKFLKSFVVPAFAISGEYRISVRARDEIAGEDLAAELKFRVKGHAPDPGPDSRNAAGNALTARNIVFLSGEDDPLGTRSAVYHPGDTALVRMDVSGYKFEDTTGEKHRFSISFGLALENAEGKQLFSQPEAGADAQESFYPQRYSTGTFTVNLDKDVSPGSYTLVVIVRDKIGDQSYEARAPFQVQ